MGNAGSLFAHAVPVRVLSFVAILPKRKIADFARVFRFSMPTQRPGHRSTLARTSKGRVIRVRGFSEGTCGVASTQIRFFSFEDVTNRVFPSGFARGESSIPAAACSNFHVEALVDANGASLVPDVPETRWFCEVSESRYPRQPIKRTSGVFTHSKRRHEPFPGSNPRTRDAHYEQFRDADY